LSHAVLSAVSSGELPQPAPRALHPALSHFSLLSPYEIIEGRVIPAELVLAQAGSRNFPLEKIVALRTPTQTQGNRS